MLSQTPVADDGELAVGSVHLASHQLLKVGLQSSDFGNLSRLWVCAGMSAARTCGGTLYSYPGSTMRWRSCGAASGVRW